MKMLRILHALVLSSSICLNNAGYGIQSSGSATNQVYGESDVEAPPYVPPYLKHQKVSKTSYSSANTGYGGTKTGYSSTKTGYGGTKTGYAGTKTGYSGTKTGYGGTKTGYGHGGSKTGSEYTETKTWYSSSGSAPTYEEFHNNANEPYTAQCTPECKNNGICVSADTCHCPPEYTGRYCELRRVPCLSYPPLPANSRRRCTSELCTISCLAGHQFPDGATAATVRCVGGAWQPARADLTSVPDCSPRCDPRCANGGVCIAVGVCQCPQDYRGPQCQYPVSACDIRALSFNGAYRCAGDSDGVSCALQCPAGAVFSAPPADSYRCQYGQGRFLPQPLPHCVYDEDVIIVTPSNYHHNSYYKYHSTNYSSGSHSVEESQHHMFGHQSGHYGHGHSGGVDTEESGLSHTGDSSHSQSGQGQSGESSQSGQSQTGESGQSQSGHSQTGENSHSQSGQIQTGESGQSQTESESVETSTVDLGPSESAVEDSTPSSPQPLPDSHSLGLQHEGVMQDLTPKPGVCLTWGGVHYKTFDGKIYSVQSGCPHILLRPRLSRAVTLVTRPGACKRSLYCPTHITIYVEDKPYVLAVEEEGAVTLRSGSRSLPIPAALPGLRVRLDADYLTVTLDAQGLTLRWDMNNLIIVEASAALWNNTEGLCGTLDGRRDNELAGRDGTVAPGPGAMADQWREDTLGEVCKSAPSVDACAVAPEPVVAAAQAQAFCQRLLGKERFRACGGVLDPRLLIGTCQWDYCSCLGTPADGSECACGTAAVYARECLRHGVTEIRTWRDQDTCLNIFFGCYCPLGLLQHGAGCVPRAQCPCRLRGRSFPPGATVPKDCNTCTCSEGSWKCSAAVCGARCSAMGDPHYSTFDGRRYDYMGQCSYTLLQATDHRLTVEVDNVACDGAITEAMNLPAYSHSGQPSCTKAVTLQYGDTTVRLSQGGIVLVNGHQVTALPVRAANLTVRAASSLFIIVQLSNKVDLWWDGSTRVYIDVPPTFRDQTKGLCGTFNLNQADDFLTPEGDVEQTAVAFGARWRTRQPCRDQGRGETEHPCQDKVQNKQRAEEYCALLKGKLFQECHFYVDVTPYYEACLYDMCACSGSVNACLCPLLGHYGMLCAEQGVKVDWRGQVKECEIPCSGGQQYSVCADSCRRTCADVAVGAGGGGQGGLEAKCRPRCVEGCACVPPMVLNNKGVCVSVGQCPCFQGGVEFAAGYKEVRAGRREPELCTCTGAVWQCAPATAEEQRLYPSAEDVRANCSARHHREFTSCMTAEPVTCTSMHLPPPAPGAVCRAGCACQRGYVLEPGSGRCVRAEQCPCHHGGTSHANGTAIRQACNTCECRGGNWSCSSLPCDAVCSSWGDSHLETFDGASYSFEGVCQYTLSKGRLDADTGFSVHIQNVPCGTTGATCAKAVTLRVGSGATQETVDLARTDGLPDVSKLKRIKLREAGAFVFLDVVSLGVTLQWDRGLRIMLRVGHAWQGRVSGLCGNYNGDSRDDQQSPGGGLEPEPQLMADSWSAQPGCAAAKPATDHCSERPSRREWAAATCGALKRHPFTLCHAEVPVTPYIERCTGDACACDSGGDCQCACAALAMYGSLCAARGVPVRWRTRDLCPMQCDEECSTYEPCMSSCPEETCDNTLYYSEIKTICEREPCVEGCKPKTLCPAGWVRANSSSLACVERGSCRVVCAVLSDGTPVLEGEVTAEDACHVCRCSRGSVLCQGHACSTTHLPQSPAPTVPSPMDSPLQCVGGWTPWISRGTPTQGEGGSTEAEPLPLLNQLQIGGAMCRPEQMKAIECRTTIEHLPAKDTGLNVECSLERGLVCRELTGQCPDFEIRVQCHCSDTDEPFQCLNSGHPSQPHPSDCSQFYECTPEPGSERPHAVLKACPPGLLYHRTLMVCDWPANVIRDTPQCGGNGTQESSSTSTTVTTPEATTVSSTSETVTGSVCPPGQVYMECAYECHRLCDHFRRTLLAQGNCLPGEKCMASCVPASASSSRCQAGALWRDHALCVQPKDCTCYYDGNIIKPGGVVVEGCVKCQCLSNQLHCDHSDCVSVGGHSAGVTHQAMVLSVPSFTVHDTIDYRPDTIQLSTLPHSDPTAERITTIAPKTNPTTVETTTTTEKSTTSEVHTVAPPIIVKSTATPPPACAPDGYKNLLWGDAPLPPPAFRASSVAGAPYEPQHAVLNGHPTDTSAGYWSPMASDPAPWIQVTLPRRQPVHGVLLQGDPLRDQGVTSYTLLHSDDGVVFSTVDGPDGKPQIFRGPVEHSTPQFAALRPAVEARAIRLQPLTWHGAIAVRFELLGCDTPLEEHYTTPSPLCSEPLGVAASLPLQRVQVSSNDQLKASLSIRGPGGWKPLYSTPGEWIMFDLTSPRNVTGVQTAGGPGGWVSAYNLLYATTLHSFNPVLDTNGTYKTFPGNFDGVTAVVHEFRPPLRARYVKVLPLQWERAIEMRVEPLGCFEPYPESETESPPVEPTTAVPSGSGCQLCPGVQEGDGCSCETGTEHWDGRRCVPRDQCPCSDDTTALRHPVGSSYRGANCTECVCKLGGVPDCRPLQLCVCEPDLVPSLSPSSCECVCSPCPAGSAVCAGSRVCLELGRWCDGVRDCPDDERNCPTTTTTLEPLLVTTVAPTVAAISATTTTTTTAKPISCPPVQCPPGYSVRVLGPQAPASTDDIPPPPPRNTYQRYYKGTKGGSTKGGYSKGGYSKGAFTKTHRPMSSEAFTLPKPVAGPPEVECVQFRCVAPLPPLHSATTAPCAAPACPDRYTLHIDGVQNDCPLYSCSPPSLPDGRCSLSGRRLQTFDGASFAADLCFHILARDSAQERWSVLVRRKCRVESGCANELLLQQDSELILLQPSLLIQYDHYEYTPEQTDRICFRRNSFRVRRVGQALVVASSKYNFTVLYDSQGDVNIQVPSSWRGSVDGLCGVFDGSGLTDRRLPSGEPAVSTEQLVRGWARPGLPEDACSTTTVDEHHKRRAHQLCQAIYREPFSRCGGVVSLDSWLGQCMDRVCSCALSNGSSSEGSCLCDLLGQLVTSCLADQPAPDLAGWRVQMGCPAECAPPLVHHDCYRRACEPQCGAASGSASGLSSGAGSGAACEPVQGVCFSGCFCPDGWLRAGDTCLEPQHCLDCACSGAGSPAVLTSFEGVELPPAGDCTYLIVQGEPPAAGTGFQVYATNSPCNDSSNSSQSCVSSLHVLYGQHAVTIRTDQGNQLVATVDGEPVYQYPWRRDWAALSRDSPGDSTGLTLRLTPAQLQLSVRVPGLSYRLAVPSHWYSGRTSGLCGLCGEHRDHLVTSNGTTTDDVHELVSSWQASPAALAALSLPAAACRPLAANDSTACDLPKDNGCQQMYNADRFGQCHPLIDPEPYVVSCESELCAAGNKDACGALARYAAECAAQGVCLDWRADLCPYDCTPPLVYRGCAACERSCDTLHAQCGAHGSEREGCYCPDGTVRHNGTCIQPTKCFPCDGDNLHYAGDEWQVDACTRCSCSKLPSERAAHTACVRQTCAQPVCQQTEDLVTTRAKPGECCDTYVCVAKAANTSVCEEPKEMECGYGQVLKTRTDGNGCREMICECKPPSECPPIPAEVEPLEPGMVRTVEASGCCPRVRAHCEPGTCARAAQCPPHHHSVTVPANVTGKCCPQHKCEPPVDACIVRLEWEGSPLGGEAARLTPLTVLKPVGAQWSDGPCRACHCAVTDTDSDSDRPAPACAVLPCPAVESNQEYRLETRLVPFQCCPRVVRVACIYGGHLYKAGENWTSAENPCETYLCKAGDGQEGVERVTTVQECRTDCELGWEYFPPESSVCCGQCRQGACVLQGELHPLGEAWASTDHCEHHSCQRVNGTLQVQSTSEKCPELPADARDQFFIEEVVVPGQCCKEFNYTACRHGNRTYQEGESWTTDDPCTNISCVRTAPGLLAHTPSVQSCAADCTRGWEYSQPRHGRCCGDCRQTHCLHSQDLYLPGSTWQSADNCTSYSCERIEEVLSVTSSRPVCADVTACPPDFLSTDGCCPVCTETTTAMALSTCVPTAVGGSVAVQTVEHGRCSGRAPAALRECSGHCRSGTLYNNQSNVHWSMCSCCRATGYSPLVVTLQCGDGSDQPHRLATVTACRCQPCRGDEQSDQPAVTEADEVPAMYHRFGAGRPADQSERPARPVDQSEAPRRRRSRPGARTLRDVLT